MLVARGAVDVFITYCTNAVAATKEQPAQRSLPVPESINVKADYGLAILEGAAPAAVRFVDFLLGAAGQRRLAEYGFGAPR